MSKAGNNHRREQSQKEWANQGTNIALKKQNRPGSDSVKEQKQERKNKTPDQYGNGKYSMFICMFLFFSASDYWSDNFDEGIKASDTFLLILYYCICITASGS